MFWIKARFTSIAVKDEVMFLSGKVLTKNRVKSYYQETNGGIGSQSEWGIMSWKRTEKNKRQRRGR